MRKGHTIHTYGTHFDFFFFQPMEGLLSLCTLLMSLYFKAANSVTSVLFVACLSVSFLRYLLFLCLWWSMNPWLFSLWPIVYVLALGHTNHWCCSLWSFQEIWFTWITFWKGIARQRPNSYSAMISGTMSAVYIS